RVEDLLELEGFAAVSARNLVAAIDATRDRPLSRPLFALGIRHVGATAAQLLARRLTSMDPLLAAALADFAAVHGLAPTPAEALHAFLSEPRNRELIERLRAAGVNMIEPV